MSKEAFWQIEFAETALKQMKKLDKSAQHAIHRFIKDRLMKFDDPRAHGKPLKGEFAQFWRYRVGDYRIIVDIIDQRLIIQVLQIGHRKEIYE